MSVGQGLCCCADVVLGSGGDSPPPPVGVSITNVGGGAEVYRTTTGPNPFELRTLVSTNASVTITQNADTIDLEVELVNLDEPSDGCNIWDGNYGPIGLKAIFVPTDGALSLSCEATRIRIDYTGAFGNLGAGAEVYDSTSTTANRNFRTLTAGTGINLTQTATEIEIACTVAAASAANVGGANEVYRTATAAPFEFRTIAAGSGIGIVQGTNTLTISNTAVAATCANVGDPGGADVYVVGSSAPFNFRRITGTGGGVTVTAFGDDIFVDVANPTLTSAGGTASLVEDGVGPGLGLRGLSAGVGVSVTQNATDVTITNTSPASSVALTSAGGTVTQVVDGTGPAISIKGLSAGTNVTLTANANDTVINATAPVSTGLELVMNVNGSDVAVSTRRITAPNRTSFATQVYVNIAAGTQTVKLRARTVSAGTITLHNVQMMGQSNLGNSLSVSTTAFTTSSNTFVDVTSITASANAGEWCIVISGDCTPP